MGQCLGKHGKQSIEEFPLECSDLQICDAFVEHLPARLQAHGLHLLSAGPGPIVHGWTHELLHESGVHNFQDREMLLRMRDRMVAAVAHHRERRRAANAAAIIRSAGSGGILPGRGSRRSSQDGVSACSAVPSPDLVPSSPVASAADIEAARVAAAAAAAAAGLGPDGKPFKLTSDWLNANVSLYRISEERSHRHLASASHGNAVNGGTTEPGCVPAPAHELAPMAEEAEGEAAGEGPAGASKAGAEAGAAAPTTVIGAGVGADGLGPEAASLAVQAGTGGAHEASSGTAGDLEQRDPGAANDHVGPRPVAEAASLAAAVQQGGNVGASQAPMQPESQPCSPSPSALGSDGAWAGPGPNVSPSPGPSPRDQTPGACSCTTGDDEINSCGSKSDTCSANESVLALTPPDSLQWTSEPGLASRLASGVKLAGPQLQSQPQTVLVEESGQPVAGAGEEMQLAEV